MATKDNKEIKIEELLTRGVTTIYPTKDDFKKVLMSGPKISIYHGIDPTGPALHLGHLVTLLKLKQFMALGHRVIILVGDFTATIGDPTGKTSIRQKLEPKIVAKNYKNYKAQISKILDLKKVKFVYNSDWFTKMKLAEVLDLGSEFTVSQMLERDMFQTRLKAGQPIFLNELLYPIMQGHDSVVLNVQAEIGGNDQTFNMLTGRTMMKRRGKEKYVMVLKILTDATGRKMGKTEGNMVSFDDSPADMYGKIMSWPDNLISSGYELCTDLLTVLIEKNLKQGPKLAKMGLARAIVTLCFSEKKSIKAENDFITKFQKKETPVDTPIIKTKRGFRLVDLLIKQDLIKSKSEFGRLIDAGGISLNNEKITDSHYQISTNGTVRVGKKRFLKLEID